ncbi:MAG: hypothetical protein LBP25_05920 [Tannerellaceae bacterium]|nr:hypothetical protein [Tannerellaceae bacterium]
MWWIRPSQNGTGVIHVVDQTVPNWNRSDHVVDQTIPNWNRSDPRDGSDRHKMEPE